jgi:septum formation protein
LEYFNIPFRQCSPEFDETQIVFQGDPRAFVCEVARRKGECLLQTFPHEVILTADTVVFREGQIYLKPETLPEAHAMLEELSGKEHRVFTGVSVMARGECFLDAAESVVTFHELTRDQIVKYHSRIHPLDKAGGYAIQKGGSLIVKRIEGCYYNIMGLPIDLVGKLLLKAGIDLWDYLLLS